MLKTVVAAPDFHTFASEIQNDPVKHKTVQFILLFLLSVFATNLVADLVSHHYHETSSCCLEMSEVDELNKLETRLRGFEAPALAFVYLQFDFLKGLIFQATSLSGFNAGSRAFFPHASHVPIYLDKCTIIV